MGRKTNNDDDRGMSDKLFVLKVQTEVEGVEEEVNKCQKLKSKNKKRQQEKSLLN